MVITHPVILGQATPGDLRLDMTTGAITVTTRLTPLTYQDLPGAGVGAVTVADTTSLDLTIAGGVISGVVLPAGVHHGGLAGLTDDDHAGYARLAGRAGGQTLKGGTGAGENLHLWTNATGTVGVYFFDDLFTNGFVKTSGGTGALSVDTVVYAPAVGINTIVTVGAIATGSWHGTTIDVDHGGTGAIALTDGGVLVGAAVGVIEALAVGATGEYLAGVTGANPTWATLNQAAIAGLTTASSPGFATVKLSGLTDDYIPYHVDDATGLANGPTKTNVDSAVSLKHTQGSDTGLGAIAADINMNTHQLTTLAVPDANGEAIRATTKITEALLESATDLKHSNASDHARSHSIVSTSDHTSAATAGKILKADASGLPIEATNTDTDVASAVSLKHAAATVSAPISVTGQALSLVNDAAATVTEIDTGALANSDTVVPTSKAVTAAFGGVVLTGSGANNINLVKGTASLDVAAGAAVNVDANLTVETASVVNQDLSSDAGPTFAHLHLSDLAAITTAAESWVGPSSTTGVYFKGGNYGFGTAGPGEKVEVGGTAGVNIKAKVKATSGASAYLVLSSGHATTPDWNLISAGDTGSFSIYDNGVANVRLVIQQNGNVGIGKTPNYLLELNTDSAGKPGVGGLWTVVSDERLKDNIIPADLDRCWDIVHPDTGIRLVRATWKPGVYALEQVSDRSALMWTANDTQRFFPKSVNVKPFTKAEKIPDGEEEYIETSVLLGDDGKPITAVRTRPKYRQEVIEDCLDLNSGQIIAAMYGALQKSMQRIEKLEAALTAQRGRQ